MHEGLNTVTFPEPMTEAERMQFLRIPDVSDGANPHNVVENLKRFHHLPCIHISRQPLYPLTPVRRWVEDKPVQEAAPGFRIHTLNRTWSDMDLAAQTLTVSPKEDAKETWVWLIKDCDRRTLPLTDEVVQMLADHQSRQPAKHLCVFVPPARYAHVQEQLRAKGLGEFEVMKLAGHSNFNTTHRPYLHVRDDMIGRARKASTRATSPDLARAPSGE